MFLSAGQIFQSLQALQALHNLNPFFGMSFLAFKENKIPVGAVQTLNFSVIAGNILTRHYRPSSTYAGFYNPFFTSRRENRWLSPRYGSTSLQRITKDTFSDALLHPSEQEWGWRREYVRVLRDRHLKEQRIPAFHLAVWLFREDEWPDRVTPRRVTDRLVKQYKITDDEFDTLFDDTHEPTPEWRSAAPISEAELLDYIGQPPGSPPSSGAALRSLEMRGVGPATRLNYEPAERLNIITGDNSLGKTFLLDCIWWALTRTWVSDPAYPQPTAPKKFPALAARVGTLTGRPQSFRVGYDWTRQDWETPPKRDILAGLAVYARHDGSFAIWDPARPQSSQNKDNLRPEYLALSRDEVWYGDAASPPSERVFNGLVTDWVLWQVGHDRYAQQFDALVNCLHFLSPSENEPINVGEPMHLRGPQEIPTLIMPYGSVPITIASAAVKRVAALAYILVWTWFEHMRNASAARCPTQRAMVLLVDEVEAHLHPRWQRVIVPAIVQVVNQLAPDVAVQVHLATHSPMVMASAETIFDGNIDNLHHLTFDDRKHVVIEELPFVKRGTADAWLMSNVFGLGQPRSQDAECAIEDAKSLQLSRSPSDQEVQKVNAQLLRCLAPDDEFWPRWRFFAKQHGVK
jgi:hypothetical protein